ncbi:hypothetical protein [Photorhabdus heterorhabditis]|uniref:hypothetical protein n=1 Tax=Photorhabdus heterorhabditis TaxID=880156 RepID=UPI0015621AFF|nr:hypothetical protein [Photorhabdus heterorhabditis]NRN28184.1 hypothetical protein [Photorhabdus heterorhabditis subsp. aluminescens]
MSIFRRVIDYFYYLKDLLKEESLHVKIDSLKLFSGNFFVSYHINKHDINSSMELRSFADSYYNNLATSDKLLMVKYLTYYDVFLKLFNDGHCTEKEFLDNIKMEIKKDDL